MVAAGSLQPSIKNGQSSGPSTDRHNVPVEDPTSNVLLLVDAAVRRLDDLREVESCRLEDKLQGETIHIREILKLKGDYEDKLAIAESQRINAIRAVDVGAVAVAAERQAAAAGVLATQVATSADQLRSLVQTQAITVATAQQQIIEPIITRLSSLERAQYEGVGKAGVTDPQMVLLVQEIRTLRNDMATGAGAKQGATETKAAQGVSINMVIAILGAFLGIGGFGLALIGTAITIIVFATR